MQPRKLRGRECGLQQVFRTKARADALRAERKQRFHIFRRCAADGRNAGGAQQLAPNAAGNILGRAENEGTFAQGAQISGGNAASVRVQVKTAVPEQLIGKTEYDVFKVVILQYYAGERMGKGGDGKVDVAAAQRFLQCVV